MRKRLNRLKVERNIAAGLFVVVLVLFSFAERDSRRLKPHYTAGPGPSAELRAESDSVRNPRLP